MKKTGIILLCILGLAFAVKVAWGIAYPSGTWRYKMTVEVETPEGVKTGSAVREVSVRMVPKLSPHMLPTVKLKGEAVVVDLGARGVLFALLSGYKKGADYSADIPAIIYSPKQAVMTDSSVRFMRRLKARPKVLDPTWYPKFVHFRDINDPKTVENLLEMQSDGKYPSTFTIKQDRFAEAFGEGVRLKSVAIEMTDEDVTWGIKKWLPWLEERSKFPGYIGGETTSPFRDDSKTYLTPKSFRKGGQK